VIPKIIDGQPETLGAHLEWRREIVEMGRADPHMAAELVAACTQSPLFFINAFVWTFRQKKVGEDGKEVPCLGHETHWPFCTWLIQDEALEQLQFSIDNGQDCAIDKSRDMGATWLVQALLFWYWRFMHSATFLCLSRKEQLVDKRGDMDSIFEKFRYMLNFLPAFLKPKKVRDNKCHLENVYNHTSIEGESTNENAGQGGRKTAIFLDEFARVPNGEEIDLATADTTACRIFNSTPSGPGTQFTKIIQSRRCKIITLPWERHPEKGRGAKQVIDELGRPKWTSPWYEIEKMRRDRRDLAQNIDRDHGQAGDVFFPYDEIDRHRIAHARQAEMLVNLKFSDDMTDDGKKKFVARREAKKISVRTTGIPLPWRLWITLVDGRPPQDLTYCFGIDVSNGSGGSNSVISAMANETGQIVAQFADSNTSPEDLAEVAVIAGVWFGGRNKLPFIAHENNGPGGIFGRKIHKMGYPNLYFQRVDNSRRSEKTERWGWNSNNARKEVLLARYREALATDKVIQPCEESLNECKDYIYNDQGQLVPGRIREEPQGGRALHGDRVIADALCLLARDELPRLSDTGRGPTVPGSFAWRRRMFNAKKMEGDARWAR
jgi:hypothetical protein